MAREYAPTSFDRLRWRDGDKIRRCFVKKDCKTREMAGVEVLVFEKYGRDAARTHQLFVLAVELIVDRLPIVQDVKYGTFHVDGPPKVW